MSPQALARIIGVGILLFVLVIVATQGTYVVEPGHRGVRVTLGKVSPMFEPEGFGFRAPFITQIVPMVVRQQTKSLDAKCYSSDLQQVKTRLRVLYRIPQESVVKIYQQYEGDPFQSLIAPRIHEALKEVAALRSAEMIVQKREEVKIKALEAAQRKIGDLLQIEDLVLENIVLSPELEAAIELKMVQEQEANKAKFTQQKTEIEARTAVIRAQGEAESIQIRGEALRKNPAFLKLEVVEKWNGKTPLIIGGETRGSDMILPLRELEKKEMERAQK